MTPERMDEMADDPREDPEAVVNAFLQHKSLEQTQDYLVRGRGFAKLDVAQMNEDWIIAVRSWLAHKNRTMIWHRNCDCAGLNHHTALSNKSWRVAPLTRKRPSERKS